MKASEWLNAVEAACQLLFPGKPFRQEVTRGTRVKARIEIGPDMFVDLFFREETGRIDYALIVRGQRRYGMDNLGGWHEHPMDNPDSYLPIDTPSPSEALRRLHAAAGHFVNSD